MAAITVTVSLCRVYTRILWLLYLIYINCECRKGKLICGSSLILNAIHTGYPQKKNVEPEEILQLFFLLFHFICSHPRTLQKVKKCNSIFFLNVSLIPACRINTLLIYLLRLYLRPCDNLICRLPQKLSREDGMEVGREGKCFNFICSKIRHIAYLFSVFVCGQSK